MPAFNVEFEVYCGTCGRGLCNRSDTDTKHRGQTGLAVTVEACPTCLGEKDDEISDLKGKIDEMQRELDDWRNRDNA